MPPRYMAGAILRHFFSLIIFKVAFEFLQNCICQLEAQMKEREGNREGGRERGTQDGQKTASTE